MEHGWIKVHRKMLKWEWIDIPNTLAMFLHLLLTVNWEDGQWHGFEVKRGQIITSLSKLAKETGLTVAQARNTLKHLQMTHEITSQSQANFSLLTVLKYNDYQGDDTPDDEPIANEQHTNSNNIRRRRIKEYKKKECNRTFSEQRGELKSFGEVEGTVMISELEFRKLCQTFGSLIPRKEIRAMNDWKLVKGEVKDRNDYRALLIWIRRDLAKKDSGFVLYADDFKEADFDSEEECDKMKARYPERPF